MHNDTQVSRININSFTISTESAPLNALLLPSSRTIIWACAQRFSESKLQINQKISKKE